MKVITFAEFEALEAAFEAVDADPNATAEQWQAAFEAAYDDRILVDDTLAGAGDAAPGADSVDDVLAGDAEPAAQPYDEAIPELVAAELREIVHVGVADMAHLDV